jgi:OTU domain-containing protein 3
MNMLLYDEDLKKFREQLAPSYLKVKEMGADGNCFFRSIADQLEGDESMHMKYRHEAVDYIRLNKNDFIPFIEDDETIEQYCDDMEKDGVWGD